MPTPRSATTRRSSRNPTVPVPPPAPSTFAGEMHAREAPTLELPSVVDAERRRAMIAEAAYFRAEQRGFVAGDALEDWLRAEAEIDALLRP